MPAKKFGVKVTQYMVGFGPTIWSRRAGETEYGIKAIPLGGYIRMIGMFPPQARRRPSQLRVSSTGRFSQLTDEARQTEPGRGPAGRRGPRLLPARRCRQKVVVMLGGPTMNLLIAVVLLGGIVTLYGMPVAQDGAVVAAVNECVAPSHRCRPPSACAAGAPRTPAYEAGLKPGDSFVSINGQAVTSSSDIGHLVGPRVGEATTVVVMRAGQRLTLDVTPIKNTLQVYDNAGKPVLDAEGRPTYHETGFLGISSATPMAVERQSVAGGARRGLDGLTGTAGVVLRIPQKMVGVAQAAFGRAARPAGPISVVGVGRIAGEACSAGPDPGATRRHGQQGCPAHEQYVTKR